MYEYQKEMAENGRLTKKARKNLAYQQQRKYRLIEKLQNEIKEIDDILALNLARKDYPKHSFAEESELQLFSVEL